LREKNFKNVLVGKPRRKSYYFSPKNEISSCGISYYFQLLKMAVVEFPTIFLGLQKLLFPFIFGGNDIPERNLITKIVVNSTTTIFRG